MGQFLLGFQALVRVWSDPDFAERVGSLLAGKPLEPIPVAPTPAEPLPVTLPPPVVSKPSARSDALSLLGVLQREGRLIDFLKEPIASFSDAEIGAAARSVHKDCAAVIDRMFGVEPFTAKEEGQPIEVPGGADPSQYRVIGNPPAGNGFRGKLAHPGWKAMRCEVPTWNGRTESAMILAPAEIEV